MKLSANDRFEYVRDVWLAFIKLRGSVQPAMSSSEWHCLCKWMDTVPLRIVLAAIRECKTKPRTLLYFERAVAETARRRDRALAASC
jgi:hypothetical protein